MQKVLIVDDEKSVRETLALILESEGYETTAAGSAAEALGLIDNAGGYDFIISDIRMPDLDGIGFVQRLRDMSVESNIIMISAYGNLSTSIKAIQAGADDYINKPVNSQELVLRMKLIEEKARLRAENLFLKKELGIQKGFEDLVYSSDAMKSIVDFSSRIAKYKSTVLISGESGTGKEVLARSIHKSSPRAEGPFVAINCAAIPESLLESELFGYAKGAFSGASSQKDGLFEVANTGTIFLDEIGEFPLHLQPKLLRVLQEEEIRRLGETKTRKIDVRVMAATSHDLRDKVGEGSFREDLFYRLNVVPVNIPPLRERKEDIPFLVDHFIKRHNAKLNREIEGVSPELMARLVQLPWHGNVRELENLLERAVILSDKRVIDALELPSGSTSADPGLAVDTLDLDTAWKGLETTLIEKALEECGGNRTKAAKVLGISRRALLYKLKEHKIS